MSVSLDRPCVAGLALGFDAAHVALGGAVELPGVQFLDAGVGIGQGAVGDAQELDGAAQVISVGAAAHVQVAVVGQRDPAEAPAGAVELAIHVDCQRLGLPVGLGDQVMPAAVGKHGVGSQFGADAALARDAERGSAALRPAARNPVPCFLPMINPSPSARKQTSIRKLLS